MVHPDGMSLEDWTATLQIDFPASAVPEYYSGQDWIAWACVVLEFAGFDDPAVPDPQMYDDWRDWAREFYAVMQNQET